MTRLTPELASARDALAAEFPGFSFATQRTWHGRLALVAERIDKTGPGVVIVITPDPGEMRRVLSASR